MGNTKYRDPREPIHEYDVNKVDQPYFYVFRPLVAIAAGATAIIQKNVAYRDFIWTHIGWTTDATFAPAAFFPNVGVPFRVNIRDIHSQKFFSDERVDLQTITGGNPQWNDKAMFELARPWRFVMNTTIWVEFENAGLVASTPRVTLGGYLVDPILK